MSNGNVVRMRPQIMPPGAPMPAGAPSAQWWGGAPCPPPGQPPGPPPGGCWTWDGTNWVWVMNPIWPPPGPPCPPPFPCPPTPGCGPVPPSCFSQLSKLNACWDQTQALTDFLEKAITQIFTDNPSIIPTPPPGSASGPIVGITDGSNAAPGQVGEYLKIVNQGTATGAVGSTSVATLVIPPGDWDCWTTCLISPSGGLVSGWFGQLSTIPPGVGDNMGFGAAINADTTGGSYFNSAATRANVTAPTALIFGLEWNMVAAATVPWTLTTRARRRR